MAWESRDFDGYLIKKIKLDDLEKLDGIPHTRVSETANDFDPDSGGSDNDNDQRWVSCVGFLSACLYCFAEKYHLYL
jgi:hypothetical protein